MSGIRRALLGALLALATLILLLIGAGELSPWIGHRTSSGGPAGGPGGQTPPERATALAPGLRDNPGIASLAASLGERRPVEPRLTGFAEHAPCEAPADDPDDLVPLARCSPMPEPGSEEFRTLARASATLLEAPEEGPTASHLHARGLWHLLWHHQDGAADRSVEALETAAALSPLADDRQILRGRILSDLAAAYLVRAAVQDRPLDLIQALDTADRALEAAPDLPEALFNHALALQKLWLRSEAKARWEAYLAQDSASPWAAEAREHHRVLSEPTVLEAWETDRDLLARAAEEGDTEAVRTLLHRYAAPARDWIEDELLPAWGEAELDGDRAEAERTLTIARTVGRALAHQVGEHLPADSVAAIDRAGPTARQALAEGHARFGEGMEHYRRQDCTTAREAFRSAEARFSAGTSPFSARTVLQQEICRFYGDSARPIAALEALDEMLYATPYPTLRGRISWMLGLCKDSREEVEEAEDHYWSAIEYLARIGDPQRGVLLSYLSRTREILGDEAGAWRARLTGLALVTPFGERQRVYTSLQGIIHGLLQHDRAELALHFQDELLEQSRSWSEPAAVADSFATRASILLDLDRTSEALIAIEEARSLIEQVPPGDVERRLRGDLLAGAGEGLTSEDPAQAVEEIGTALDIYEETGHQTRIPRLLAARAQARTVLGAIEAAEKDLVDALRGSVRVTSDESPGSRRRIREAMVRLQLDHRSDPVAALYSWDRFQDHRPGLVHAPAGSSTASVPDPLLRTIPPGVTLIRYATLDDRVVIWRLGRGFRAVQRPIPEGRLERRIAAFVSSIETGASEERILRLGAPLYDLLIRPVLAEVSSSDLLILIPDGPLHRLPFGALWDRREERYLVEASTLALSSSLSDLSGDLLDHLRRSDSPRPRTVLAVGTSTFDRERYPHCASLPNASEEARAVASLYPAADLLLDQAATPEAVATFLERRPDVLSISSHTVLDPLKPERSGLLLAPDPGAPGRSVLTVKELSSIDLSETELVVLSACRSATVFGARAPGYAASVAPALFGSGESLVIATLWDVDDHAAAKLTRELHARYIESANAVEALRGSQRHLIAEDRSSVRGWAAFVAIVPPARPPG